MTTESKILKDLIKLSGLNQKQFAEKHGITEANLSLYLSGSKIPRKDTITVIAFNEGYEIETNFKLKKL